MKKNIFFIIFVVLIVLILFAVWQFIYLPKSFSSGKETIFTIEKGEGSKEISVKLEKAGLIKWGPALRAYVILEGVAGKLQAGNYRLSSSMNIPQMVGKFVKGVGENFGSLVEFGRQRQQSKSHICDAKHGAKFSQSIFETGLTNSQCQTLAAAWTVNLFHANLYATQVFKRKGHIQVVGGVIIDPVAEFRVVQDCNDPVSAQYLLHCKQNNTPHLAWVMVAV